MNNVIIIGSGIAGLATAARLVAKGYNVSIFESASVSYTHLRANETLR